MDSPGHSTLYRPEFAEQAYSLCLFGITNQELADHFGVARSTIDSWRQDQPAFAQSLKRGRLIADAQVASALHACALGYSCETTRIVLSRGELVPEMHTVRRPPDVQACLFWLRNRRTLRRSRRSRASSASTPAQDGIFRSPWVTGPARPTLHEAEHAKRGRTLRARSARGAGEPKRQPPGSGAWLFAPCATPFTERHMTQRGLSTLHRPQYPDLARRFCQPGGANEELAEADERRRCAQASLSPGA